MYDYSKTVYKTGSSKVIIICPIHKEFEQIARNHIFLKQGCPICGDIKCGLSNRSNTDEFIEKASRLHQNRYDYSKTKYIKNSEPVIIICPIHKEFSQLPCNHLVGTGCSCCATKSIGEKIVRDYLTDRKISFKEQIRLANCKRKRTLPFDFGIYGNNDLLGLIEYQGRQHYKEGSWIGLKNPIRAKKDFTELQERDKIKQEYCKRNNIPLLLIRFDNVNTVKQVYIKYHRIFLKFLLQLDVVDYRYY